MPSLSSYLKQKPLVAILRGIQPKEVIDIANVLVDSGFSIIEVPLNSPDPLKSISLLADKFEDKILIGAGTVIHKTDVKDVKSAGARLVVTRMQIQKSSQTQKIWSLFAYQASLLQPKLSL